MKKIHRYILILLIIGSPLFGTAQQNISEFKSGTIDMGIIASDFDASLKFYTEVIGMQVTREFSVDADFAKKAGLSNGRGQIDVTVLKTIDEENATELKLMTFGNKTNVKDKYLGDKNGMRYITIFVKTIEPFIERIKEDNIPFLGETPVKLPDGRDFVLIQDPDGVFVELIGG